MSQQIIDLTLRIENNMLAPDCFPRPVYIKAMTHEKSIECTTARRRIRSLPLTITCPL